MQILNKSKISIWVPVFCSFLCTSAFGTDFQGQSESAYAGAYLRYTFGGPIHKDWSDQRVSFGFNAGLRVVGDVDGLQQFSPRAVRTAPILDLSFTQHGFSRLMVADRTFRWDDQVGFHAADDQGSGMRAWLTTAAVLVGAGVIVAVATTNCEVTEERIGC